MEPVEQPKSGVNWAQLVIVVLLCIAAGLVGLTLPYAKNASHTGDNLARSDEIAGCSRIAGAGVTDARNTKDQRDTDLSVLNSRFEEALLNGDVAGLEQLRIDIPPAREALEKAAKRLDMVNREYQRQITASNEHPDAFLARCRAGHLLPTSTTSTTTRVSTTSTSTTVPTPATVRRIRRTTPVTGKPTTTTTGTTSTTVLRSSPRPYPTPTTCLIPLPSIPGVDTCL